MDYETSKVIDKIIDATQQSKEDKDAIESQRICYFRGHYDESWLLLPSIFRNILKRDSVVNYENRMYKDVTTMHHDSFKNCKTTFEKLCIMQHMGIPTRLLDITSNPLIALYFATHISEPIENSKEDKEEVNGKIHVFKIKPDNVKTYDSDTVSILSNLARMSKLEINKDDSEEIKRFLHFIRVEKSYFKNAIQYKHLNNHCEFVEPIKNTNRIIAQSGAFILFGSKKIKNENKYSLKDIDDNYFFEFIKNKKIVEHESIIIEGGLKEKIREELHKMNITEASIYNDLQGYAKYLKYYPELALHK